MLKNIGKQGKANISNLKIYFPWIGARTLALRMTGFLLANSVLY